MTDEKRSELVSRSLDGDLSDAERVAFEQRLLEDEALAGELESMRLVRAAVARVADEMQPPAALDAVMKPMRLGPPAAPRRVRPAFRWLGAAAAIVLGVTVAVEMTRRNPTPTLGPETRPRVINHDDREIFKLAPLPSAVPDSDRPLGATERLLEEEPAYPEAPEPEALEIIGPLTEEEHAEIPGSAPVTATGGESAHRLPRSDAAASAAAERGDTGSVRAPEKGGLASGRLDHPDREHARQKAAPEKAPATVAGKTLRDKAEPRPDSQTIPVEITIGDVKVWTGWASSCTGSRWAVLLDVRNGEVVGVESPPEDPEPASDSDCRLDDLIGARLEGGITDGRHRAQVDVQ